MSKNDNVPVSVEIASKREGKTGIGVMSKSTLRQSDNIALFTKVRVLILIT